MSENMTVCPKCGTDFDTVEQEQDLPIQALHQQCPDCEYWVKVAIINWPDKTFDVVAPALSEDESCQQTVTVDSGGIEQCNSDPVYRTQSVGSDPQGLCPECAGEHVHSAMDMANDL